MTGLARSFVHMSRVVRSAADAVGGVHLDDEVPADVDVLNGREAERVQGIGDRLALRIEKASTWHDVHGDAKATHSVSSFGAVGGGGISGGRLWRGDRIA